MVREACGCILSILLFPCVAAVRTIAFFGTRTREDVMRDALANICRTHVFHCTAPVLERVAQYL